MTLVCHHTSDPRLFLEPPPAYGCRVKDDEATYEVRTAIVTGVTGHLGSELARQLVAAGTEVHGLSRTDASSHLSKNGMRLHRIDGSTNRLLNILEMVRPDVVFHVAGLARRAHQTADVSAFIDANIHFGAQLLEAMRRSYCPLLITAGTYLQHFNGDQGGSMNLYAATKDAFETLIQYYVDAFDMAAVRLTLCDIYSEGDKRRKLMTDIADACASDSPLTIVHDGARLDLVHVEDAARAFMQTTTLLENGAAERPRLTRYSVSSGYDVTIADLISAFELISGRKLTLRRNPVPALPRDMGPWRGDLVPGWSPRICLESGIKRMLTARGYRPPLAAPTLQH